MEGGMKLARYQAIRVAKDLLYPDTVVESLKKAKTEREIYNILVTARKRSK